MADLEQIKRVLTMLPTGYTLEKWTAIRDAESVERIAEVLGCPVESLEGPIEPHPLVAQAQRQS